MRSLLATLAVIVVALVLYVGSAAVALQGLAEAARAADGAAVLARTDVAAVKRSLAGQIVGVYIARAGEKRALSSSERFLANTVGGSLADALIDALLTPERLTQLLKTGRIESMPQMTATTEIAPVATVDHGGYFAMISRLHLISFVQFSVRVSDTADPETATAIRMHLSGLTWKLSGIDLPRKALRDIAAGLPVR